MKLVIFNKTNSASTSRPGLCSINVNRNSYSITFSQASRRKLGIKAGWHVLVAQDEDSKNDWFIGFSEKDNGGFKVNEKKGSGFTKGREPSVYFRNKFVVNKLLDAVEAQRSASFLVSAKPVRQDGVDWYNILTVEPLMKK